MKLTRLVVESAKDVLSSQYAVVHQQPITAMMAVCLWISAKVKVGRLFLPSRFAVCYTASGMLCFNPYRCRLGIGCGVVGNVATLPAAYDETSKS